MYGQVVGLIRVGDDPMRRTFFITIGLAVLVGALFGVLRPKAPQTPVELERQISSADRVVLTNSFSSFGFSGGEAQALVRAVSQSEKMRMRAGVATECPAGLYLEFYRGTQLLARVEGDNDHFQTHEGHYYKDKSGALQAAWQTLYVHQQR